jgi:histidyl-tRNA synthetase
MPSYEALFTEKGFAAAGRAAHAAPPANPRERAEAVAKQAGIAPEQVVKALAVKVKATGAAGLLLLPVPERPDMKAASLAAGVELDFYPLEQIPADFGAPVDAVSPFNAPEKRLSVFADGRLLEQDTLAVSSGDPLSDVLVSGDDLRAFLGAALVNLDLESAKRAVKAAAGGTIEPRILKGFRDYLPEEMLPRQAMIATIMQVFERFGFAPLQTPALEYSDILLGKMGSDAEKLLFRFRDNGGRDICLRYDLTVPLARVAAQYGDLPKPFKRYQIAPVWRAEKPGRGRFREFFQCDCDVVGSPSLLYDAECIALDFAVMQALGVKAEVRFNNRKVLAALGTSLAVSDERQMMAIFRTIDKLPSQGRERVRELLKTDARCNDAQVETILQFCAIGGPNAGMLKQLEALLGPGAASALDELKRVHDYVLAQCGEDAALKLDFSIARGLDYYTGSVYETFLTDLPGTGSVMSGGRYDGLIERYLGRPMPAVGISVGIDRLFSYLVELKAVQASAVTSRVLVVAMDAECLMAALKTVGMLRAAGVAAEIAIDNEQKPKLDKQMSIANKKGIPYAAILGSNEVANGTLMLKNLATREQQELNLDAAIAALKA